LRELGGKKGRPLFLGSPGRSRLLLTGQHESVETMRNAANQMLGKTGRLTIPMHPEDTSVLRRPKVVAELEQLSGCRFHVDDRRDSQTRESVLDRKEHRVHLLGDPQAQDRALQLLTQQCKHLNIQSQLSSNTPCMLTSFDRQNASATVQFTEGCQVVRRMARLGEKCPSSCVVVGSGQMRPYAQGSFFCLGIRKLSAEKRVRGGIRVGVMCKRLEEPVPVSLMTKPAVSWVLGRGSVRGPRARPCAMPAAIFDTLDEGDELGVLVARTDGSIAVFRRPGGPEPADWVCMLHWDAHVDEPGHCFALLEMSGRLVEVELLQRPAPFFIARPFDELSETPPIWPPTSSNDDSAWYLP